MGPGYKEANGDEVKCCCCQHSFYLDREKNKKNPRLRCNIGSGDPSVRWWGTVVKAENTCQKALLDQLKYDQYILDNIKKESLGHWNREEKMALYQKLSQMQSLPLEAKIEATKRRIREWFAHFPDASVSFSGGKDSTVLLDIVRQVNPKTVGVFIDTGLEYPEIRQFVKTIDNTFTIRPEMSFLEVIQKYGYPVIGKRISRYIQDVQQTGSEHVRRLRLEGLTKTGRYTKMSMIPEKWQWLCDSDIKISDRCCHYLKKKPATFSNFKAPFIGTMASDSELRFQMYIQNGCNGFMLKRQRSTPMAFWKTEDVWEYIKKYNLPYSKIYDMGYERTGCMFCMFGLHCEGARNRFEIMSKTHPQLYKYCMDGPLKLRGIIKAVYGIDLPKCD